MSESKDKHKVKATPVITKDPATQRAFSPQPIVGRPVVPKRSSPKDEKTETELVSSVSTDIEPTVYSEGPFDIVVKGYDYDIDEDAALIRFPKEWAANLSATLSNVPDIANSINNYRTLGHTAYSITLDGKDVMPHELFRKKNDSLISNLKGEKSWGRQTDVNPIDFTEAKNLNVANAIFGVASAVTSTYYLKTINDNLVDLKGAVENIYEFLTQNEQSQIEADIEILEDIKNSLPAIANNDTLKEDAINKLSTISREAAKDIKNYEKRIRNTVAVYKESNRRSKKKQYFKLQIQFYYYTICLGNYALSEMLLLQIADAFDEDNLNRIREHIIKQQCTYKELYAEIDDAVELGLPNIIAISTFFASWFMDDKLSMDNRFSRKVSEIADGQVEAYQNKEAKLKKGVLYCDETVLDPVIESIDLARYMNREKIMIVASEDDYYLQTDQDTID